MAESNFVDYVKILCRSGKGGAGAMHLYRAKYVPKGGPDGGEMCIRDSTKDANPPVKGSFNPAPKRPSITQSSELTTGGVNWLVISKKSLWPVLLSRSRFCSQSADKRWLGIVLKRYTTGLYPRSINNRDVYKRQVRC